MIKSIAEKIQPAIIEIDLTGPDGNAFALIAYAAHFGKEMGMDSTQINKIITDMKSGDYENLLQVFDEQFGHIVNLYR